MSGTSLDGLDMALCRFQFLHGKWEYEMLKSNTLPYDEHLKKQLMEAMFLSRHDLSQLDIEYGHFIGSRGIQFIRDSGYEADLIASHGHTVFHQPDKKLTLQIGNGAEITSCSGIPVVCDFRKKDVALGGQGAPLVPVGDELLFGEYDYCLNLGGFANVSFIKKGKRRAFDICPVNIVLNEMARMKGKDYDRDGEMGRRGNTDQDLLQALNNLEYYKKDPPKSLGKEWLDSDFMPALAGHQLTDPDTAIRTIYEHIAQQAGKVFDPGASVLVTGGGVYNEFLMERISSSTPARLVIPDDSLVQYKEALIFALLGALRWYGMINCYASVTGASSDSSAGSVFL